jgi:hypothetical protein
MFVLSCLEDDIRIEPKDLAKTPLTAVTEVLEQLYIDKVVLDLGLVVSLYDVQVGAAGGRPAACQAAASATHQQPARRPSTQSPPCTPLVPVAEDRGWSHLSQRWRSVLQSAVSTGSVSAVCGRGADRAAGGVLRVSAQPSSQARCRLQCSTLVAVLHGCGM